MARTTRRRSWFNKPPAEMKVRLSEALRWRLESEARTRGHSMNVEIVRRLRDSFLTKSDSTTLIAELLLEGLDGEITEKMVDIVMRSRADDELADMVREDELTERDDDDGDKKP